MISRLGVASRWRVVRWLAVAMVCAAPALALAQAATVDQVLAALAEVVKDRAKQVATRTIANDLKKNLCEGEIALPPFRPPESTTPATGTPSNTAVATRSNLPFAPEQPTATTPLRLYLGGKQACRDSYSNATPSPGASAGYPCDADDVFLRTCRLAKRLEVPLTDAYLLKSLSRDTIDFLMRVSGRNLSASAYMESGLVEVGAFIHAVLEQLAARKPSPRELADPTLALADRLSAGIARRTFADLDPAGIETTHAKLLARSLATHVVGPWTAAGCPPFDVLKGADGSPPARCESRWYLDTRCDAFEKAKPFRDEVYRTIFGTSAAPGPLYAGRDEVCGVAFARDPHGRELCRKARLTINLYGFLVRSRCTRGGSDDVARSRFRELGYVVAEHGAYEDAFVALASTATKETLKQQLSDFLDDVHALDLSELPREELGAGIRVVGRYAASIDLAPEATRAWLQLLAQDLESSAQPPFHTSYSRLLHGAALGTDAAGTYPPPVTQLRVAVKDLLTLPALAVLRHEDLLHDADDARQKLAAPLARANTSVRRLLGAIQRDPVSSGAYRDYVVALAAFLSDLADVTVAMGEAVDVVATFSPVSVTTGSTTARMTPEDRKLVFERAATAMKQGALALQLAADRDWVGLAIRVSDEVTRVPGATGKVPELDRSLRFVRILLSMYQAGSVEEAKAIFASNLEDLSSRERRYAEQGWTADVGALVAFNVGHQYSSARSNGQTDRSDAELYGLSAPFGLQLAYEPIGFLLYPVDLGAYMTSPPGDGGSNPRWEDALRAGALFMLRPSGSIPIVIAGGGDYRPRFQGREAWRWYVSAGLELPLYLLH